LQVPPSAEPAEAAAVLTIGRLRPGGAEYYVGEIATSAEDYYLGHGEAPGRWVGSLAADLGLQGQVDPNHFRRLLEGRHPFTAEQLVGGHRADVVEPHVSDGPDCWLNAADAGAQLRCSERYVRRLLRNGVLAGEKAVSESTGHLGWRMRRSELNRYAAAHHKPKARPGFDVTLRPPKSVSILWALGDEHRRGVIRDAHREAVDEVVRYLEGQAIMARSRGDQVLTAGLVGAAFDHRTSRAGDPLLHTHVVIANMTFTALDTWRALDGRPLYDHALSGGHLYQAHLRHLLSTRLGVRWGPVHNGWAEVIGVPARSSPSSANEGTRSRRCSPSPAIARRAPGKPRLSPAEALRTTASRPTPSSGNGTPAPLRPASTTPLSERASAMRRRPSLRPDSSTSSSIGWADRMV
jgi:hypothetical protein